jgi:UDP-N-acetylmuramate dehydrogenase
MIPDSSTPAEYFRTSLGRKFRTDESLAGHAHFRIGGPADYFYTAATIPELVRAVELASFKKCPFFILGGGYNLLFDDDGYRGLVIKNSVSGIERLSREEIRVFSGTPLPDLIRFCILEGMEGAEFLAGIPGTLGGAVFGNAGALNHNVGELISRVVLLSKNGSARTASKEDLQLGYRTSTLKKTGELVLEATLHLKKKECREVEETVKKNLAFRKGKHPPWGIACAGSYFKNPVLPGGEKVPAGYLLEKAGAKKLKVGDAVVYRKHANFIINRGNASCRDVQALAEEMKRRVKNKFDFNLEEEVIYLPANP